MVKKKVWIGVLVIGVLLVVVFAGSRFLFAQEDEAPLETMEDPYGIEYFIVPSMEQVFVNGIVKPEQSQEFRQEDQLGEMGELQVSNGDSVEEGTLLYTYENKEVSAQLSDLANQVSRMETQRANAVYRRDLAVQRWNETPEEERVQTLEEVKIENSTSDMDAEVTEMYNNIESLKSEQYADVVAPFSGKVYIPEEKNADSPVLKLISDHFYVSGTVNEKDIERLSVDQTADIKVVSTETIVTGKVSFIDVNPAEDTGDELSYDLASSSMSSYPVKLTLDTLDGIRNGNHVQATINIGESTVSIPAAAIHEEGDERYVLVNDFGTVVRRVIQAGEEQDGEIVVTSGLEAEDMIIVSSEVPVEEGEMLEEGDLFIEEEFEVESFEE